VPGQPGDPAQHLQRLYVKVGPLRSPRGDQLIHLIAHSVRLRQEMLAEPLEPDVA
jgi:hypothetical protein